MRARLSYVGFALLVVAVLVAPAFSTHYRLFQYAFVGIYLIALLGLNILTGFTGQISLGHGAFMGMGAYTTTILVTEHGWNYLLTLPLAGLVAGVIGLLFGLPATRFAGPYLALATFAIPLAFIGMLKRFPHFTGGTLGKQLPAAKPLFGIHANTSVWLYWVAWVIALVSLVVAHFLVRGRFGRALRSVRDSEIASTANGISTAGIKTIAFGISAFYCGVAGGIFAVAVTYVNPDTFPIDLSILLLTGIVIGGAGSLGGMVFGAFFVEFIRITWGPWLLDQFSRIHSVNPRAPGSSLVVYGIVLLVALYVAPSGAAGLMRRLLGGTAALPGWLRPRRRTPEGPAAGANR